MRCAHSARSTRPTIRRCVVFRRTRLDVGIGATRRIHTIAVSQSAAERRMHRLLASYGAAVRSERREAGRSDACLALSVLHKRAFSSAWALARSVERRLSMLASATVAADAEQLALPLGDPYGELVAADEPPAWPSDLTALRHTSRTPAPDDAGIQRAAASRHESKLAALCRLLRRAGESAVVFTEYRDTLMHLRERLLRADAARRRAARPARRPRSRGTRGGRSPSSRGPHGRLLLATDAAAEGLNLHRQCRLVVNLELPWNPMRLEQRIGRVDRIGQRRTVHAFHLIAREHRRGADSLAPARARRRRQSRSRRARSAGRKRGAGDRAVRRRRRDHTMTMVKPDLRTEAAGRSAPPGTGARADQRARRGRARPTRGRSAVGGEGPRLADAPRAGRARRH